MDPRHRPKDQFLIVGRTDTRRDARKDLLFLAVIATILLSASSLLFRDLSARAVKEGLIQIGYVQGVYRETERKYRREVVWGKLEGGGKIYEDDTVRTDARSGASLRLENGVLVELGENTMIRLSRGMRETSFDLIRGTLRLGTEGPAKKKASVSISSEGNQVVETRGNVFIEKLTNGLRFSAVSEGVTIRAGRDSLKLESGKKAIVRSEKTEKIDEPFEIRPLFPPPLWKNAFAKERQEVLFRWALSNGRNSILEVSEDAAFSKAVFRREIAEDNAIVPLPAGEYFWRVWLPGRDLLPPAEVRGFRLIHISAPDLRFPAEGAKFSAPLGKINVYFGWSPVAEAEGFILEISTNADFKNPLIRRACAGNEGSVSLSNRVDYFWRVQTVYRVEGEGLSAGACSATQRFGFWTQGIAQKSEAKEVNGAVVPGPAPVTAAPKVIVTEKITLLDDRVVAGRIVEQNEDIVVIETDKGRESIPRRRIKDILFLKARGDL